MKTLIKINSGNQIINVNAINVNIDTRDILKKDEKSKKSELSKNNIAISKIMIQC